MASPQRDRLEPPDPDDAGSALPEDLLAIRERLKQARAQRGACPPWDELRADLLPGGGSRYGRAERIAHFEMCPYCEAHVTEWRRSSFDHASDTLGAIERGVAKGIVDGARGLAGKIVSRARRVPRPAADAPPALEITPSTPPVASASAPAPSYVVDPLLPRVEPPPPPPPRLDPPPSLVSRERPRPVVANEPEYVRESDSGVHARPVPRAVPQPTGGLLVVECVASRTPPESVFLCAAALGLDVACVDRVEELDGDPDAAAVQAVIIASDRAPEDWPAAVKKARRLAPGKPVLVLAMFGQEAPKVARRALGEALLEASASAEELLLALDPRLR
jgi:hypothetical protein